MNIYLYTLMCMCIYPKVINNLSYTPLKNSFNRDFRPTRHAKFSLTLSKTSCIQKVIHITQQIATSPTLLRHWPHPLFFPVIFSNLMRALMRMLSLKKPMIYMNVKT
jgi:hypothetical protein